VPCPATRSRFCRPSAAGYIGQRQLGCRVANVDWLANRPLPQPGIKHDLLMTVETGPLKAAADLFVSIADACRLRESLQE
jgi:hypothetical protein